MPYQFHPYSIPLGLAFVTASILAIILFRHRNANGAKSLFWCVIGLVFWAGIYAIHWGYTSLSPVLLLLNITYIGVYITSVSFLLFAFEYTHQHKHLNIKYIILLSIIPLIALMLAFTNKWHFIFYNKLEITENHGYYELKWDRGIGYYLFIIFYNFILSVYAIYIFIKAFKNAHKLFRNQIITILTGIAIFWIFIAFSLSKYNPYPNLDLSPFAIAIECGIFAYAIIHYKLFDLVPVARSLLVESMSDSVLVIDKNNRILDINPQAKLVIHSFHSGIIIGKHVADIFKQWPQFYDQLKYNTEIFVEIKLTFDYDHYYDMRVSSIFSKNKDMLGKLVVLRDITSEKINENRLLKINRELRRINETKDQLFKIIAHDLRGPMGNMRNLLEVMAENENLDANYIKEYLNVMKLASATAYDLLENLLNWAKSQRNDISYTPEIISINKVVSEVIENITPMALSKQVLLENNCPLNLKAYFDTPTITVVIRNLIMNALKFSTRHGIISVNARLISDEVIISVEDNGVGMTDDILLKIFVEKRFVTTQGTANEKGSGLGLMLCRDFVAKNGGKLWAESKIGQGTKVFFSLAPNESIVKNVFSKSLN